MNAAKDHLREEERLASLDSYSILDSLPEEDYDNLTSIAAEICGTPISLVSLLDDNRQWFKSRVGLNVSETPKEYAFCAHAINEGDDIFVVQDSRLDKRFHDNPLVIGDPRVIFYAGIPLIGDEGLPLGTLCVIDHKPKLLSQTQMQSLKALGNQVMNLMKLRKINAQLKRSNERLNENNKELEQFAYIAAHDLKSPLNNISSTSELLLEHYSASIDDEGKTMLSIIKQASEKLRGLIDGLLEYSSSEAVLGQKKSNVDLVKLCNDICGLFAFDTSLSLDLKSEINSITINKTAIDQILINLVSNAVKYNDKNQILIELGVVEAADAYEFYVKDNGPGIAKEYHDKIFQIFQTQGTNDKFGKAGNGIGLATVKKIVDKMGGQIRVESGPLYGSTFIFSLKKDFKPYSKRIFPSTA